MAVATSPAVSANLAASCGRPSWRRKCGADAFLAVFLKRPLRPVASDEARPVLRVGGRRRPRGLSFPLESNPI